MIGIITLQFFLNFDSIFSTIINIKNMNKKVKDIFFNKLHSNKIEREKMFNED